MVQKQLAQNIQLSSTENKTRKRLLVYKPLTSALNSHLAPEEHDKNTLETKIENSGDKKETSRGRL